MTVGIPYANANHDGTVTCPVCGQRIAEHHDATGEVTTTAYGDHYARNHADPTTTKGTR